MEYPEEIVCAELRWEYNYSKKKALAVIDAYKQAGKYHTLCRMIEKRKERGTDNVWTA